MDQLNETNEIEKPYLPEEDRPPQRELFSLETYYLGQDIQDNWKLGTELMRARDVDDAERWFHSEVALHALKQVIKLQSKDPLFMYGLWDPIMKPYLDQFLNKDQRDE